LAAEQHTLEINNLALKISGLKELTKQLEEAQKAIALLDGDICKVEFDPSDPSSIDAAIQTMEFEIDKVVGRFSNNPLVAPMIAEMKAKYRQAIFDKAATARATKEVDDNSLD
jgi:hypothetical protein